MSRYDLVINGTSYQVEMGTISGTRASVTVNGVAYQVEIPAGVAGPAPVPTATAVPPPAAPATPRPAAAPAPAAPTATTGGEVVIAPMPGHILNVLFKAGDVVEVGDTVIVMEAMKMENEIKAHAAGTVTEIKVAKGQDVGVGEVLVVIGV